ncbi:hypothetical protein [Kribbella qitaiheensis]|uniref:hypothetical protein n=1 Tax=Kribbella qitaiheensis TaxID=1544730 RepID=UPI001FE2686D|nr:hypothetical protein [Kribbella qitaiheensis]
MSISPGSSVASSYRTTSHPAGTSDSAGNTAEIRPPSTSTTAPPPEYSTPSNTPPTARANIC